MTPLNSVAVDLSADDSPPPLASWYAEGSSDGVGDRLLMFDNSGTPSLELLRFRPELAAVAGFEAALRARVDRLHGFAHPAFTQARGVEQLNRGALTLVSTYTPGKRLAELIRSPRGRGGVHPAFAAWLIRDLTAALVDLQQQGDGIAHGGLTAERVVLTADGRLVITEHVLGGALDCLRLPASRLWRDLELMAPDAPDGTGRLDERTDVIQVAWIVLSALLGRRITPTEYPQHVEALLDEFAHNSGRRAPALLPALRCWLERALRSDGHDFGSASEAWEALRELGIHGGPHAIDDTVHSRPAIVHEAPRRIGGASDEILQLDVPQPDDGQAPSQFLELEAQPMAIASEYAADLDSARSSDNTSSTPTSARDAGRRLIAAWAVAGVFVVCALVEAVVIARLAARQPVAVPAVVPITFESPDAGDPVIVDGRQIGVTPLQLQLTPAMRSVRVQRGPAQDAPVAASLTRAATTDRPPDPAAAAAIAQAAARERRGGLRLSAPVEIQVLEGERVLGSSVDGPIVTTAGRHELDFVNSAIGYRARHVVDIKPGQIVKMTVAPPDGRVSINAIPWAQVWINGAAVGDTPIANLRLAAGETQITFRHPQLGEQTQKVIVRAGILTRVSATFAR